MAIKTTSFKLDSELLKELKIEAIRKDIQLSELVDEYLREGLKRETEIE